jgi:hypothetical protein
MRTIFLPAFAIALSACNISTNDESSDETETGDGDSSDACSLVLDQSYASREQLECGLGPDGVVLCNWTIDFDGSQYVWNYSDVGQSDAYACDGLDLLSVPGGEVLGTVTADGAELTWAGVLYDQQ